MSSPSPPLQCGSRDSSICERLQRERVISLHSTEAYPTHCGVFFSLILLILTRVFRRKIEQQHRHRTLWRHLCETVNLRQYRGTFRRNRREEVENLTLLQFSCFKIQLFEYLLKSCHCDPYTHFHKLRRTLSQCLWLYRSLCILDLSAVIIFCFKSKCLCLYIASTLRYDAGQYICSRCDAAEYCQHFRLLAGASTDNS